MTKQIPAYLFIRDFFFAMFKFIWIWPVKSTAGLIRKVHTCVSQMNFKIWQSSIYDNSTLEGR